ncbi:MAG: ParB/RepB/Spo0J family partition protein [Rhizomicrobium sp.]
MELKHIPLADLHISPLNMRHEKKAPDVTDILPSIRARGILQPLLVRANAEGFEVVAGRRRYYSAKTVEQERGSFDPVPCAVMEDGEDAAAVEASLIENIARRDADPITQYETFVKLIKEGKKVEEVAATFGMTPARRRAAPRPRQPPSQNPRPLPGRSHRGRHARIPHHGDQGPAETVDQAR